MRRRENKSIGLLAVALFIGIAVAPNLNAATIDFEADTVTTNPDNIQFTSSDGVVVTVSGWQAEFPTTTTTIPNVWGPFPTTSVATSDRQIFGNFTRNQLMQLSIGLSVETTGSLTPTETDTVAPNFQPLFDNNMLDGTGDEIQFALFEYSESVSVSQIIADTSVNNSHIWLAGGLGAVPDFSIDFLATLTSLGVTISLDTMSGPEFAHNLTGFNNVDFLLVGTNPFENTYGPLPGGATSNFGFSRMTLGPAIIPIPATAWLFGSALGLLAWLRRNKPI
jgi:hypothetical protein